MDLLLIQDLQPLFRVICLKYFISIADQIDLYKVRDLFSSSTTRILICSMIFPPFRLIPNIPIVSYFDLFFLTFF